MANLSLDKWKLGAWTQQGTVVPCPALQIEEPLKIETKWGSATGRADPNPCRATVRGPLGDACEDERAHFLIRSKTLQCLG
jgi:hypothetical protein